MRNETSEAQPVELTLSRGDMKCNKHGCRGGLSYCRAAIGGVPSPWPDTGASGEVFDSERGTDYNYRGHIKMRMKHPNNKVK